ncbi:MAG: transporter substrate-binding domain-containing protein [Rhodospirillaceae bacterium]|jgi:general L-amino acid transport system substrate-binding protein|nr:transporter substrate-binding domain-containing protein [Rhodospirillaceae bacterium]
MKRFGVLAAAAIAVMTFTAPAKAGETLDAIKARGHLQCIVNTGLAGFGIADSQGKWVGLDIDYCRALAAAILGDANAVKYTPTTAQQRFTALQSGEGDVLARNTTWTLTRDASLGFNFVGVNFYDGQGFMVKKDLGVTSSKELDGAEVCVQTGTTTELNLADYFRARNMSFKPVVFEDLAESITAFFNGRCQVYTTDASGLASIRATEAPDPSAYVILPEIISKEPLGPVVRRGDDEFFAVAKWVLYALLDAEEKGITSANVDDMRANSQDPNVQRLLGASGDMADKIGLSKDWAYNAIKQAGNYGEMFARNVGPDTPLKLERGLNALWTEGGLMYAPPIR